MSNPPPRDQISVLRHYLTARDRAEKSNRPILLAIMIRRGQPPVVYTGTVQSTGKADDTIYTS